MSTESNVHLYEKEDESTITDQYEEEWYDDFSPVTNKAGGSSRGGGGLSNGKIKGGKGRRKTDIADNNHTVFTSKHVRRQLANQSRTHVTPNNSNNSSNNSSSSNSNSNSKKGGK